MMIKKNKGYKLFAIILCLLFTIENSSGNVYAKGEPDNDEIIMVSLGDSYSSGEGIEPFYGQDEDVSQKVKNEDWLAHRSTKSWPGQLSIPGLEGTMSAHKDENWFFVAASGAVTDNLKNGQTKEYDKSGYFGTVTLPNQLSVFDNIEDNKVDYVTFTFGGNDVGFSNIITTAVMDHWVACPYLNPSKLSDDLNETWEHFYEDNGTQEDIKNAYISISESAGENAEILVAGYPKLLEENTHFGVYWKSQAEEINANVSRFNKALSEIVDCCKENGMNISFVSVEEAFDGHAAYSDDSYINSVKLVKSEDLKDFFKDLPISAYSIHPNEAGARVYASCVQEQINQIERKKAESESEKNLEDDPLASDDEINADALHYNGILLKPEDVVVKMFDALQKGDYEEAAECLDPATEQQLDVWGGIVSTLVGLLAGEYISWGQLLLEAAGATDVDVIECYSYNLEMESNVDFFADWLPVIPGINNLVCTEADVYVKYRYKYNGEYKTEEETCHVRRYEWSGWRIEQEY